MKRRIIGILLPEPHLDTGGNRTLIDFAEAASEANEVVIFFVRHSQSKSDKKRLRDLLGQKIRSRSRVFWLGRILDSHLAPGVSLDLIRGGQLPWTALRFLLDIRRLGTLRALKALDVLIFSQYLSPKGVESFRALSSARTVLNMAGHPETLRNAFRPSGISDSAESHSVKYSKFLMSIDYFLFQTSEHRRIFVEREPWAEHLTEVIRPSVDTRELASFSCESRAKCNLFDKDRKTILSVGKMGHKGQDVSLAAFSEICKENTEWDLHYVGSLETQPNFVTQFREEITRLGLSKRVFLWGHRYDLPHFLRCADILVLSSVSEGAPRIVREAMYSGLAIVTLPIAGVTEMLDSRSAFIALEPHPSALAKSLQEATMNSHLRWSKAEEARRRFSLEMSPDSYSKRVLTYLQTVLKPKVN